MRAVLTDADVEGRWELPSGVAPCGAACIRTTSNHAGMALDLSLRVRLWSKSRANSRARFLFIVDNGFAHRGIRSAES